MQRVLVDVAVMRPARWALGLLVELLVISFPIAIATVILYSLAGCV